MVRITFDVTWLPSVRECPANKAVEAGVQTSYVHSSKMTIAHLQIALVLLSSYQGCNVKSNPLQCSKLFQKRVVIILDKRHVF